MLSTKTQMIQEQQEMIDIPNAYRVTAQQLNEQSFCNKKEPQKVNVNGSSMCMNPDWNWDDQAALCIAIAAGSTLFTGAFWQECSESSTVIFHQRIPFAFDRWKISLKYGLLFPVASVIAF